MIPAAPLTGIAAPLNKPAHSEEIDRALQARVSAREIPGVVAMAANEQSVVYEGAFGFRDMTTASRMSTDTIFRIASMVKLLTSVAALQLVERGKLKLDEPAGNVDPARVGPGSRRFRCERGSATASGAKAHNAAQPADAHGRVQLSALGSECRSLSQGCPPQSGLAAHAADVRAWFQVGLWRRSVRLTRASVTSGIAESPRSIFDMHPAQLTPSTARSMCERPAPASFT
jgi:hypothetical protein